ncbi:MAG: hypothetical protein JXA33_05315 [Anaerolineae bacterium]|nr:hypothetical protein [Anaerolineae bacterium]
MLSFCGVNVYREPRLPVAYRSTRCRIECINLILSVARYGKRGYNVGDWVDVAEVSIPRPGGVTGGALWKARLRRRGYRRRG